MTTVDDLPDFANAFGKSSPRFDLDNDGVIGFGDLLIFARTVGEG
jgi:Ca2+-binding EF-hand superfamily protein